MYAAWDYHEGQVLEGHFDLTLPQEMADRFRSEVVSGLPCALVEQASEEYYEWITLRIYPFSRSDADGASFEQYLEEPDGTNFHLKKCISLPKLCDALRPTLRFLRADAPTVKVLRFFDVMQRNDIRGSGFSIELDEVVQLVDTPSHFFGGVSMGDNMRFGFAPVTMKWYLRMHADWDEAGQEVWGHFDLTLPEEMAKRYRREIVPGLGCRLVEEASVEYYERIRKRRFPVVLNLEES